MRGDGSEQFGAAGGVGVGAGAGGAGDRPCVRGAGESYLDVLDGLYEVRDRVRLVTCRFEAGAVNMAEAYGKLHGRPAAAMVTRGPGACHGAIGVHIAMQDSTPMLLFVGQIPFEETDRDSFQEVDYRKMFGPLAKWVTQIDDARRIPELVAHAVDVAVTGRPGPVVVALSEEMQKVLVSVADVGGHRSMRLCPIQGRWSAWLGCWPGRSGPWWCWGGRAGRRKGGRRSGALRWSGNCRWRWGSGGRLSMMGVWQTSWATWGWDRTRRWWRGPRRRTWCWRSGRGWGRRRRRGTRACSASALRVPVRKAFTEVEISPEFNALNLRQWERNGIESPTRLSLKTFSTIYAHWKQPPIKPI